MGLFDKKYCDICGEKIGLLGNRKLEDGNLCKDCAKKLSPWFCERRNSTVEEIRNQLEYREQNKEAVMAFRPTREMGLDWYHIYVDEQKGQFTVARRFDRGDNPDIIHLSQIVSCYIDIDEDQTEEYRKDSEGNRVSYNPPRFRYTYDYFVIIGVNSPYFDELKLKINSSSINGENRRECMEAENAARQILGYISQTTGVPISGGMGMNNGMGMPNMNGAMGMNGMYNGMGMNNMNNGMSMNGMNGMAGGMGMNNMNNGMNMNGINGMAGGMGMNNMNNGMNMNGMAGGMNMNAMNNTNAGTGMTGMNQGVMQREGGQWTCPSCGMVNTGKFCEGCGGPRQ